MGSLSVVHAIAQSLPYHGPSISCVKYRVAPDPRVFLNVTS